MNQLTFAEAEYASKRKQTRRERFLAEMDAVVPWSALLAVIEPHYPKPQGPGRRPYPMETMLRVHLMQNWFGYSDPGMEEALYEVAPLRQFARLSLSQIPDETTILNFRHLLEAHGLAAQVFAAVNTHLTDHGLFLRQGTIVDATIISAPSSTKNASRQRDPEMHQTRKGNQWYFGMKAHIGVDRHSGLVHTVTTTPANDSDISQAHALLHGDEQEAHGDAGYTGVHKRPEATGSTVTWRVAERRSRIRALPDGEYKEACLELEHLQAQVRARVEHPFRVIKQQFKLSRLRFKGLAKNSAHVLTLFALANLWTARRRLAAATG